jgi:hypothetical protein
MKKYLKWAKLVVLMSLSACNSEERNNVDPVRTMISEFEKGSEGWLGDYALYNLADTTKIAFLMERDSLPAVIDSTRWSLRMEGNNVGDSIFLFLKKKIGGLNPDRTYNVSFDIDVATNYPDQPNGSGKTIKLKAGASAKEPVKVISDKFYNNVSIKKGLWDRDGAEMSILGDFANTSARAVYELVRRTSDDKNITVKPAPDGTIWICVGEDTRYKGKTVFYYDKIKVTLTEQ